jgi:hypothetical protein
MINRPHQITRLIVIMAVDQGIRIEETRTESNSFISVEDSATFVRVNGNFWFSSETALIIISLLS